MECKNNGQQESKGGNGQERGTESQAPEIPRQEVNLSH